MIVDDKGGRLFVCSDTDYCARRRRPRRGRGRHGEERPLLARARARASATAPRSGASTSGFDLWPGEVLGVVGESGSGKTTVLSCLRRRVVPTAGRVSLRCARAGAVDMLRLYESARRRLLRSDWGVVHQNPRDGLRMGVTRRRQRGRAAHGARRPPLRRASGGGAGLARPGRDRRRTASTTCPRPSRAACSSGCRSRATW